MIIEFFFIGYKYIIMFIIDIFKRAIGIIEDKSSNEDFNKLDDLIISKNTWKEYIPERVFNYDPEDSGDELVEDRKYLNLKKYKRKHKKKKI